MVMIRRGTFRRCMTEVDATASGGEMIAPTTNAVVQRMPGTTACATHATAVVVTTTRPMASSKMGRRLAEKSRHEVNQAAENKIGGRNSSSTSSGASRIGGKP